MPWYYWLVTVLVVFLVCTGYLGVLGWRQVIAIKNLLRDEVGDLLDGIHKVGDQARSDHQTWLDDRAEGDAEYAAALIEATRPGPRALLRRPVTVDDVRLPHA